MRMQDYEFWFVVGSQFLYGPEVLETVAARASEMADVLNASGNLPCKLVYKVTAKTKEPLNKSPSFSAERENRRLPLGSSDSVGK